jgi:hypothetical protein
LAFDGKRILHLAGAPLGDVFGGDPHQDFAERIGQAPLSASSRTVMPSFPSARSVRKTPRGSTLSADRHAQSPSRMA